MKPLQPDPKNAAASESHRGGSSPDADLVRAAWRGDKQAFVEIVARHQAMVCGVALGVVGSISASEDVAQEAFLIAWRKIHELREPERLRAWLRQIARNAALGHQRNQRGHDALEEAPDLPDLSPTPDEQAATEEEAALVRVALTQLPEIYREPLILYYRENQSTKAVAAALDISEDAVRQRLARGRELLRDQVPKLIEKVLNRTRPTPIFTMTVAVAVGALTPPAAVAGGVFSAAASGASAAGTSGSFVKAVVASKAVLFVAAIAMIVCIPMGYRLRASREASRLVATVPEQSAKVDPPKAPGTVERNAIFAEWKRLHDVHGTNVEAMGGIYREIAGFRDPLWRQGFRAALMAEWVQLNPTNVMAAFRDRTIDSSQRRQFIDEWLARDPVAAIEVFMKGGRSWENIVRNSLPELARREPSRVASAVARLPGPDSFRDSQVREAFAIMAERGIDAARDTAEALSGPNRDQALAGVAQTWGQRDLESAIAWARKLPNGTDQGEVIRAALVGAASVDPVSGLERVGEVPPGGKKGSFASTTGARVLQAAATADFDATVAWLAARSSRLSADDVMGLASAVGEKLNADPAGFLTQYAAAGSLAAMLPAVTNALAGESSGQRGAVWEWLKGQPEDSTTRQLKFEVLSACGEEDAAMAFRLASDAPPTAAGDVQLSLLADGLLRHGAELHRLEKLLETAPLRLKQPLLECAFSHLGAETLEEPQRWIALLSQLPLSSRGRGAEAVSRAWGAQAPEDALRWAASMPTGEARARVVAAIVSAWAVKDSPAAAIWIAAMSPGAERDWGAQSLVFAIAEEFPREAWEWAMSISDADRRALAAAHAAKLMAARDSVTARALVENGPLTHEAKAAIQSALATTSRGGVAP